MEKFVIEGGRRLTGEVVISGAKNAAVAILPATILAEGPCVIENIPNISDVTLTAQILCEMGADVRLLDRTTLRIDTTHIHTQEVAYEMAKHMRASYYFLGSLLGRYNRAKVAMRVAVILVCVRSINISKGLKRSGLRSTSNTA